MTIARKVNLATSGLCVALSLSLVACGGVRDDVADPIPSLTSTPTPTPTLAPVIEKPPSQFPADCGGLLTAAQLSSVVGFAAPEVASTTSPLTEAIGYQTGTLQCEWKGTSGEQSIRLMLTINRHVAIRERDEPFGVGIDGAALLGLSVSYNRCRADDYVVYFNCSFGAVVGDYRLTGYADGGFLGATNASMESMMSSLAAPGISTLESSATPALWTPPAGSWDIQYDCSTLASASMDAVLGGPASVIDLTGHQYDDQEVPRDTAALGGSTLCLWNPDADDGLVPIANLAAGAAWFWDDLAGYVDHVIEPLELDGVDDAALACHTDVARGCEFYARVGVNAFSFGQDFFYYSSLTREQALAGGKAIIAALE